MTEYVWTYLNGRGTNQAVLHFYFDPHDIRFASLDNMMWTFLSQLGAQGLVSESWGVERMMSYITTRRAWKAQDLIFPLLRWTRNLGTKLTLLLGGLDQCEGPIEDFISMLHRYLRDGESRIRIVILTTTGKDSEITNMLSRLPSDSFREWNVAPESFFDPEDDQLPFKLRTLLQNQPRLLADGVETTLGRVLSATKGDHNLRDLILSWCGSTRISFFDMKESLELLSQGTLTPEVLFEALLSKMPQEKRDWAKQLLVWISFSVRPLRVEELCIVSQMISPQGRDTTVEDILCWLGGILQVKHDEIRFSHEQIRPWLVSGTNSSAIHPKPRLWCQVDANDVSRAHLDILKHCLSYICSPEGYTIIGLWPTKHVFAYAWQYWTIHYDLAKSSTQFTSARETALSIFTDDTIFRRWINAYHDLANPLTRPDPETSSSTSIAAHFGLDDLLEVLMSQAQPDWAVLPAMIEAARTGHLTTLTLLKQQVNTPLQIANHQFQELVEVAVSCGLHEILQEVITLLPTPKAETDQDSEDTNAVWLSNTLIKACWLGNKGFVQVLLDLGGDMHSAMPPSPGTTTPINLLSIAITVNAIDIVELLLSRGWDLETESTITRHVADNSTKEMAELLIKNGWDFKRRAEDNKTVLQRACATGKPILANLILEREPNFAQYIDLEAGGEPLIGAVVNQNHKTLQALLKHGADVNVTDIGGNALYVAISGQDVELCRLLLEHPKDKDSIDITKDKIDVNYCAPDNKPPLVLATTTLFEGEHKLLDIVRLLLENGADVRKTETSSWARTPLLGASAQEFDGIEEVIKLLLESGSEIDAKDSDGWTPLYTAASLGTAGVGKLLIESGADLYAADEDNLNCLHVACRDTDFTRLLLDHGVDPFQKYKADVTPLQMCARGNFTESLEMMLEKSSGHQEAVLTDALVEEFDSMEEQTIRILLDYGASVNRRKADSNMSLIARAMGSNREDILRLLLEYRPELDQVDDDENTALHYINDSTSVASVKALANATAKLDVLNKRRQSPLIVAIGSQNWDVVRYLLSRAAVLPTLNVPSYLSTPLHLACRLGTLDIIKRLIDSGADPNLPFEDEGAPISQACLRQGYNDAEEKEDMIRFLLEKNDGVLAPAAEGSTGPLHNAALTCSEAIIRLFIEHGADKTAEDKMGRRPLHLACYNSLQAVKALDVPDGEFAARDKVGRVPLHYAVMAAYSGTEDSLLEYVLDKTRAAGLDVDVTDNDGWTPLLWSVRDAVIFEWADDDRHRDGLKTLQKLVENQADPGALGQVKGGTSTGSTLEKQWSLLDIAAYHNNAQLVRSLAETAEKAAILEGKSPPRVGIAMDDTYCDCCYLVSADPLIHWKARKYWTKSSSFLQVLYGEYFECDNCSNFFQLCFKCYGSKNVLHPLHDFIRKGGEVDSSAEQGDDQPAVDENSAAGDLQHEDHSSEHSFAHESADIEDDNESVSVVSDDD